MARWQQQIELDVLVQIDSRGAGRWDSGRWDTAAWSSGAGAGWASVYDRVISVSTDRGRAKLTDSTETGTCTFVVDNDDGWASLVPDAVPGQLRLLPGRPVQIVCRPAGTETWLPLWTGSVESVADDWQTTGTAVATIGCTDALSRLAAVDPLEGPAVGGGELVHQRLDRIATAAGWAGPRRFRAPGTSIPLQSTVLSQNLLTEAQLTVASARQVLTAERDGAIGSADLWAPVTPVFWLTDVPAGPAPPGSWSGYWCPDLPVTMAGVDAASIVNRVQLGRAGSTVQTVNDPASEAFYGTRSWGRTDLICSSDTAVQQIAADWLANGSWPRRRISQATVNLADGVTDTGAGLAPTLQLDPGVGVRTDADLHPDSGPAWGAHVPLSIVTAVSHDIDAARWTMTVVLDNPTGDAPVRRMEVPAWH